MTESVAPDPTPPRLIREFERWKSDLIDLSRRNRLIYYRTTPVSSLEVLEPGPDELVERLSSGRARNWRFYEPSQEASESHGGAMEGGADTVLEEYDEAGRLRMIPSDRNQREIVSEKPDAVSLKQTLRALERKSSLEFIDKGIWVLYLGVGLLRWREDEGEDWVESPILLVPVELRRASPREPFVLYPADEDSVVNPALHTKMEAEFGIELPESGELDGHTPSEIFQAVEERIMDQKGWSIQKRSVLATFSFYKEVMYRDLEEHRDAILSHPVVRGIALGGDDAASLAFEPVSLEHLDEEAPPEELATILDADSSQRQCIQAARDGRSFVMDGPPGTGKSQTIANIVAELMAQGKSVLFVSEKAAALDVVLKRFQEVGLDEFVFPLHSHQARRKEVARLLGDSLVRRVTPPQGMSEHRLMRVKRLREDLSAYAEAINESREPLGLSLQEAIGRVVAHSGLPLAPPASGVDRLLERERFEKILQDAARLQRSWGPIERGERFLWRELAERRFDTARVVEIQGQVRDAREGLVGLRASAGSIAKDLGLQEPESREDVEAFVQLQQLASEPPQVPRAWLTRASLLEVEKRVEHLEQASREYDERLTWMKAHLVRDWLEVDAKMLAPLDASVTVLAKARGDVGAGAKGGARGGAKGEGAKGEGVKGAGGEEHSRVLEWSKKDLQGLAEAAGKVSSLSKEIASGVRPVFEALGLDEKDPSLKRVREVMEVVALMGSPSLPEAAWLNPLEINRVEQGLNEFQNLQRKLSQAREAVAREFSPEVVQVEGLEAIAERFRRKHHGWLRVFSSQYRADRDRLKPVTLRGKVDKSVVAHLGQAVALKRLKEAADARLPSLSQVLGDHYAQGRESDLKALEQAFSVAKRVVDTVGDDADLKSLADHFARTGTRPAETHQQAKRVAQSIQTLDEVCRAIVEVHGVRFVSLDFTKRAQAAKEVSDQASASAEIVNDVDAVAGNPVSVRAARAVLHQAGHLHRLEQETEAHREEDAALLGPLYEGLKTDWQPVRSGLAWSREVRALTRGAVGEETAARLLEGRQDPEPLAALLESWVKKRDRVLRLFEPARGERVQDYLEVSVRDGVALLKEMEHSVEDIHEWAAFWDYSRRLDEAGVGNVVSSMVENQWRREDVEAGLERSVLQAFVDDVLAHDERLGEHSQEECDSRVVQFQELDRALLKNAVKTVAVAGNDRRPRVEAGGVAVIRKEANKKRRHMPIRRLLEDAGPVVQKVKPVFMMSPLSVSQFLPSSLTFDAVVFDEASQVLPCDAVNCIYRGAQLIVAGDQRQLPPTPFFQAVTLDEGDVYEEGQLDEFESVLDRAKVAMVPLSLRWHYRSRHEALITYSNYAFYDGRLVTFPSARETGDDLGVAFFHVPEGVYRRGGPRDNPVEAGRVVDRVFVHAKKHPHHSVGVVTFSNAQAMAIEDELEKRRREAPELDRYFKEDRLDGFFVKNIENVQGDERDIMIFSVGYGPDEEGKTTMNFGPLNQQGGERRLNVAITRAKRRVEIVSSLQPEDFKESTTPGVNHLRRYLQYARDGHRMMELESVAKTDGRSSRLEDEIVAFIESLGYKAERRIGVAGQRVDIGVRHPEDPDRFFLGVECDGPGYRAVPVARDRDRLREEVLTRLGWRIVRAWAPAWFKSRHREEKRLREALEEALGPGAGSKVGAQREEPRTRRVPGFQEVDLDEQPAWVTTYTFADPAGLEVPYEGLDDPSAEVAMARFIERVLKQEGPVSTHLLERRLLEFWDEPRMTRAFRATLDAASAELERRKRLVVRENGFLALPDKRLEVVRVPDPAQPASEREVGDVPDEELILAIRNMVQEAVIIEEDELTQSVSKLFGWQRRGYEIRSRLGGLVAQAVEREWLQRDEVGRLLEPEPVLLVGNGDGVAKSSGSQNVQQNSPSGAGGSLGDASWRHDTVVKVFASRERPRQVLQALVEVEEGAGAKTLAGSTGLPVRLLVQYLDKLLEEEVLQVEEGDDGRRYRLVDPERVKGVLEATGEGKGGARDAGAVE